MNLVLNLKGEYFDDIKAGKKPFEYRLRNAYWSKRIVGKWFDYLIIRRGYPKSGDPDKEIILDYAGWEEQTITHPHFGDNPVTVFAIRINPICDTK